LDTGPILAQQPVAIEPHTIYPQLEHLLAIESAKLLNSILPEWIEGKIIPQAQDDQQATYTKIFTKADGLINWQKTAFEIDCQIRALTPWPGTYTTFQNKRFKILTATLSNENLLPGEISFKKNQITIGCGDNNSLIIIRIQEEGKSAMNAQEFISGHQYLQGAKLV
jgi:methionyl-tRNA formyltransferase